MSLRAHSSCVCFALACVSALLFSPSAYSQSVNFNPQLGAEGAEAADAAQPIAKSEIYFQSATGLTFDGDISFAIGGGFKEHAVYLGFVAANKYDDLTAPPSNATPISTGNASTSVGVDYGYRFNFGQIMGAIPETVQVEVGGGLYWVDDSTIFGAASGPRLYASSESKVTVGLMANVVYREGGLFISAGIHTVRGINVGFGAVFGLTPPSE